MGNKKQMEVVTVAEVEEPKRFLAEGTRWVKGAVNGAGWLELVNAEDFEFLHDIDNKPNSKMHRPIQHHEAIDAFGDRMAASNLKISAQVGLLSPNKERFQFICDIADADYPDFAFQLGFLSYNNGMKAFTMLQGENVFVCSNGSYFCSDKGDKSLRQRHVKSSTFNFTEKIDAGIERFKAFRDERLAKIDAMKKVEVTDRMFANLILDFHRSPVFGSNPLMVQKFVDEFDHPRHEEFADKTLWHFHNAVTEELKVCNPVKRIATDAEFTKIFSGYIDL